MYSANLLSGNQQYSNRQYLKSLKHFQQGLQQSTYQHQQLVYSTLIALNKMQLANYNQAALILNQTRQRLQTLQRNKPKIDYTIIKIKVLTNLMVIMLINCNQQMYDILNQIIVIVREKYQNNSKVAWNLFKLIISSLFGEESFQNLDEKLNKIMSELKNNQLAYKNSNSNKQYKISTNISNISPILLSSYSIYCHLSGNYLNSLKLQQIAYQLSKNNNIVACILSLKHLQQLSILTRNDQLQRKYKNELKQKMKDQQFQGVAQQTLFRNYKLKIEHATKIIKELIEMEKQFREDIIVQDKLIKIAVLAKLKRINRYQPSQQIQVTIQIIQKSQNNVLQLLQNSQFINIAKDQYIRNLIKLVKVMEKIQRSQKIYHFFQKFKYKNTGSNKNQKMKVINIDINNQNNGKQTKKYVSPKIGTSQNRPTNNNHYGSNNYNQDYYTQIQKIQESLKNSQINTQNPQNINNINTQNPQNANNNHNSNKIQHRKGKQPYKIAKEGNISKSPQNKHKNGYEQQSVINQYVTQKPTGKQSFINDLLADKYRSQYVNQPQNAIDQKQGPGNIINQFVRTQPITIKKTSSQNKLQQPLRHTFEPPSQLKKIQPQKKQINKPYQTNKPYQKPFFPQQSIVKINTQPVSSSNINNQVNNPGKSSFINPINNQPNELVNISKIVNPPSSSSDIFFTANRIKKQKYLQSYLKTSIVCVNKGQFIHKRHVTSDGGDPRYLKITKKSNRYILQIGQDQDDLNNSYNIQDIKGIIYGKATQTMIKSCNKTLQPWKCFSIITTKKTIDLYLQNHESDIKFWLPGLSYFLKELNYSSKKYNTQISSSNISSLNKKQKASHNKVAIGETLLTRCYSLGRVLWKRFLLRLQTQYLIKKKDKKNKNNYNNANAYCIVLAANKLIQDQPVVKYNQPFIKNKMYRQNK